MVNNFLKAAAVSAATVLSVGALPASAAIVDQLIHFDDLGFNTNNFPMSNGSKDYTTIDSNFFVEPNYKGNFLNSGNCAASVYSGNGSCLGDSNKGEIATVTRLNGDFKFSLLSFYFNLLGDGGNSGANWVAVTDSNGVSRQFTYNQLAPANTTVANYPTGTALVGNIEHNKQYVADVTGVDGFKSIMDIVFTSSGTANVRVDCIKVSYDDANGTLPTSDAASGLCGRTGPPPPPVVPLPAAGWMLLAGVGGLAAMRRRKKRS